MINGDLEDDEIGIDGVPLSIIKPEMSLCDLWDYYNQEKPLSSLGSKKSSIEIWDHYNPTK